MSVLIFALSLASLVAVIGVRLNRWAFLVGWGSPTVLALAAEVIDSVTAPGSTGGFTAAGHAFGLLLFLFVALGLAPIIALSSPPSLRGGHLVDEPTRGGRRRPAEASTRRRSTCRLS